MEKTCITKSKNMYEDIDTLQKGLLEIKAFIFKPKSKLIDEVKSSLFTAETLISHLEDEWK